MYFEIYGGEYVSVNKIDNIEEYLQDLIDEEGELLSDFPPDPWSNKRDKFNEVSCNCDCPARILIKGEIIVPKKKETVTKYVLE